MFYNKDGTFIEVEKFKTLQKSFELKNEKKIHSKRMGIWGWHKMPDIIKHWSNHQGYISIPAGLRGYWNFEDRYSLGDKILFPLLNNEYKGNELDLKQDIAIKSLLSQNIGLLHASTGVGKTIITAKIIKEKSLRTLIVVSGIELMTQMRDDLKEVFGVTYKTMSGIKKKQQNISDDIIIGNIDTLVKQDADFFKMFDVTILDEVDTYMSSDTRRELVWKSITSKYIYGLTGTIKLNYIPDKIFDIYFGPKTELLEKHFSPDIKRVITDFQYTLDDIKNFHELKKALYENEDRNALIVKTVLDTIGDKKGILFSEYIEHAKIVKKSLEEHGIKCFLLIGEIDSKTRIETKKELISHQGRCILIGSVKIIGRGFNVPELSVGYLTTCEKFQSNIGQYMGRIIRKFPNKKQALWFDFIDPGCNILMNQSKSRMSTYKKEFPSSKIEIYI